MKKLIALAILTAIVGVTNLAQAIDNYNPNPYPFEPCPCFPVIDGYPHPGDDFLDPFERCPCYRRYWKERDRWDVLFRPYELFNDLSEVPGGLGSNVTPCDQLSCIDPTIETGTILEAPTTKPTIPGPFFLTNRDVACKERPNDEQPSDNDPFVPDTLPKIPSLPGKPGLPWV